MKLFTSFLLSFLAISSCALAQDQTDVGNQTYIDDAAAQYDSDSYSYLDYSPDGARSRSSSLNQNINPVILGGDLALRDEVPYIVSLRRQGRHVCGGAVISENFILTAAQCVVAQPGSKTPLIPAAQLSIRAGSLRLNQGGMTVAVQNVIVHPQYRNRVHDIALLRLRQRLLIGDSIAIIPIAEVEVADGDEVNVAGWGRPIRGAAFSRQLRTNVLTKIADDECAVDVPGLTRHMLCFSHEFLGNGICIGDIGGPAVFNDELVGIANFVVGRCGNSKPDVFAKVSEFLPFIRANSNYV